MIFPVLMANPFEDVITRLERQKVSIDRALAALREVDDGEDGMAESTSAPVTSKPVKSRQNGKRKLSAESRRRMVEGQRKRWAAKRAGEEDAAKKATSKGSAKKLPVKAE